MQQRKTATFSYNLIRAKRKTLALRVEDDGLITVRAPLRMSAVEIDRFVEGHSEWLLSRLKAVESRRQMKRRYTEQERTAGKKWARNVILQKCQKFGEEMEVDYAMVSIREQKTRWGSCSSKGNLNFNWKLILMPEEILDYVVVHELAHRKEMNHSPAFWSIVEQVLPDYKNRREWLKKNGGYY